MLKAMISQPMNGLTDQQIKGTKQKAERVLYDLGYAIIDTFFEEEWANPENMKARGVENIPVAFLAKSIEKMAECNAVYFCKGYEEARGCRIEHQIAQAYGLTIIYEED
ncbi:MAG: DUF4406 domain-containing protein [Lachnospiraceae bacterium]|nr:DUF4406 domain-containing protein [Lachnospiraceae bacterium]MCM1230666.1 DUF4406 domain-containing protein [Ruminococcus flavefaciens]